MSTLVINAETGREAVFKACTLILAGGREVSPRGQRTLELAPVLIEIANPTDTLPTGIGRKALLPAIGAAEALQNIAGVAQPHLMSRISKFFPKPTGRWDEGIETYGPRLGPQMGDVVRALKIDNATREAVASIWRAGDLVGGQAHNLCTVALQFLLREGRLDMHVYMRSNDAWYGLCYDLFQFAQVQCTVARCVNVEVGRYYHHATSLHLYERHWEAAAALGYTVETVEGHDLRGIGAVERHSWLFIQSRALELLEGGMPFSPTKTERWYHDTLAPFGPDGT